MLATLIVKEVLTHSKLPPKFLKCSPSSHLVKECGVTNFCCCFWKITASFQESLSQLISMLRTLSPWTQSCGFVQTWDLNFPISSPFPSPFWILLSCKKNIFGCGEIRADSTSGIPFCHQEVVHTM